MAIITGIAVLLVLAVVIFLLVTGSSSNNAAPDAAPSERSGVVAEEPATAPENDDVLEQEAPNVAPEASASIPVLEIPGSGAAPIPEGATKLCVFGTTKFVEFYLFEDPQGSDGDDLFEDPQGSDGDDLLYVGGSAEQGYIELPAEAVYFSGGGVSGHRMVNSDGTQYYLTGHELTVTPPSGEGFTQIVRSWENFGC
ncbi:hypothetical protein [Leucobacter komagatae]|uniref:Uncharacterized protein n=1 Tax=Leucobacter komagatae TaxID=55969 RepID=A0A0D0H2X0_9MICO|nr:hypothetical protein [Leucobacter komagatae]KIP51485.1 hypothetical protein SD72_15130 [Leucobacter komagatae]